MSGGLFDAVVRGGGGAFDEAHRCACGRIGFEEELDADVEVEDPYPMFVLLVAVVCNVTIVEWPQEQSYFAASRTDTHYW